jgi:hypothetical protein
VVILRLGKIGVERDGAADQRDRIMPPQLMRHHAKEMTSARVTLICGADKAVQTLRLDQATGAIMVHRD